MYSSFTKITCILSFSLPLWSRSSELSEVLAVCLLGCGPHFAPNKI